MFLLLKYLYIISVLFFLLLSFLLSFVKFNHCPLSHNKVAALYKTPWKHIKKEVHSAIAERAMMHFDNGLQLKKAPRSWINKKYTVDQLMEQWKEPEVVVVNYNDVIVRGK